MYLLVSAKVLKSNALTKLENEASHCCQRASRDRKHLVVNKEKCTFLSSGRMTDISIRGAFSLPAKKQKFTCEIPLLH